MKKEIIKFLFFFPFSYRGMKMEKSEKIPVWYRGMKISGMKKEHAPNTSWRKFCSPKKSQKFFYSKKVPNHLQIT
jgi:hypothetical protein